MGYAALALGIIAGVSALYSIGKGAKQKRDAKRMRERNKRPTFNIQDEYYDNQSIAENQAGQGFTSKTVENYNTQTERGFQAAIDAQLQTGGGPNTIQGAFANYNLSNRNFAAADSEKQTANIENLYARNKDIAAQKVQGWVINDYQKFKDEAAAAAQMSAAGDANISQGINSAMSAAGSFTSGGAYSSLMKTGSKAMGGGGKTQVPNTEVSGGAEVGHGEYFQKLSIPSSSGVSSNQFSDYYSFLKEQEKNTAIANAVTTANGVEGGLTQQQLADIEKIISGKYNFKDEGLVSPF